MDHDKVSLIKIAPQSSSFGGMQDATLTDIRNGNFSKTEIQKTFSQAAQNGERGVATKETLILNETAEERQRTGRYLAIGVTLIMLFIAFYHTLLRHATFLAGLLAPAIIMLLYILWFLRLYILCFISPRRKNRWFQTFSLFRFWSFTSGG